MSQIKAIQRRLNSSNRQAIKILVNLEAMLMEQVLLVSLLLPKDLTLVHKTREIIRRQLTIRVTA